MNIKETYSKCSSIQLRSLFNKINSKNDFMNQFNFILIFITKK